MPAKSAKQYGLMQAALHGSLRGGEGPSRAVAREYVDATASTKRSKFAKSIKKNKKY